MPMESLSQRSSVTTQDAHPCSTQQPGGLTDAVASATDHVSSPSVSDVCQFCMESCACDDLNCIKCNSCGFPTHTLCLIKFAKDKSAKKFQGAATSWLHDLLYAAGLCFYCQVCQVTSQATVSCSSTHTAPPTEPNNMQSSINCIESKIDLLIPGLLAGASQEDKNAPQLSDKSLGDSNSKTDKAKSYSDVIGTDLSSVVKCAVSASIKEQKLEEKSNCSVIIFCLEESKNDIKKVHSLLQCDMNEDYIV